MAGILRPTCSLSDFYQYFAEMPNHSELRRCTTKGQDELKVWLTNCPPFIMPPALYPGEVVQLKEHRILCIDATSKPLIGAVFITNYRVIFSGNPVEDPSVQQLVAEYQDAQPKPALPVRTMHRIRNKTLLPSDSPREGGSGFIRRTRLTLRKKFEEDVSRSPRAAEKRSGASGDELDDEERQPGDRTSTGKTLLRSIRKTWQQSSRKKVTTEPVQLVQSGDTQGESEELQSSPASSTPSSPVSKHGEDPKPLDFEKIPDEFLVQASDDEERESVDSSVSALISSDSEEEEQPTLLTKSLAPQISGSAQQRLSQGYVNFQFFSRSAQKDCRSKARTVAKKPPVPAPRFKKANSVRTTYGLRSPILPACQKSPLISSSRKLVESYDVDSDSSEDEERKSPGAARRDSIKSPTNTDKSIVTAGDGLNSNPKASSAFSTSDRRPSLVRDDTLTAPDKHSKEPLDPNGTPQHWKVHRGRLEKSDTIKAGDPLPTPNITDPLVRSGSSPVQQVATLPGARRLPLPGQGSGELQSRPHRPPPPVPPNKPVSDEAKRSYTVGVSSPVEYAKTFGDAHQAASRSPSLPIPPPRPSRRLVPKSVGSTSGTATTCTPDSSDFSDGPQENRSGKRISNGMVKSSAAAGDTDASNVPQPEQAVPSSPGKQNPLSGVSGDTQETLPAQKGFQEPRHIGSVDISSPATSNGSLQSGRNADPIGAATNAPPPGSTNPRIKDLTSYENFLPIAWRKKVTDSDGASVKDDQELEKMMVERSYLSRSLRSTKGALLVDQGKNADVRKSYTMPKPGSSVMGDVPVVPVNFESHLWVLRGAMHGVKRVQNHYPIEDSNLQLVPGSGIFILCKNFHSLKLFVHPHNTYDADALKKILEEDLAKPVPPMKRFAVSYRRDVMSNMGSKYPIYVQEERRLKNTFSMSEEVKRLGLDETRLWAVSNFLEKHPDISPTYPPEVIVPRPTPEVDLERVAPFYRESRFPVVTWRNRENGALLFRGAAAAGRRGGTGNKLDQSLFQQICGCLEGKDDVKLYLFTEKEELNLKTLPQGYSALSSEQKEAYFYSGVKFVYAENLPTYKSVRRSFNKLMSLLENKGSSSFLSSLEHTGWLHRISDLLAMGCEVCALLSVEAASVLVAYETGRDITTQIVSLAQLLLDPFYRTMEGFQMLIQKEWLWFSHPFASRHGVNPDRHGEAGPVFLQWIDCVWQIMQQCPSAFEFNELFLETLAEHSYSTMFRTFLVNTHQEGVNTDQAEGISFWTWVSICNQTDKKFFNCLYDRELYPGPMYVHFEVPCLRLWTSYYCKLRAEHNLATHSTQLRMEMELLLNSCDELYHNVCQLEVARHTPDPMCLTSPLSLQKASHPVVSTEVLDSGMHELVAPAAYRGGVAEKAARDILIKHRAAKAQLKFGSVFQYLEEKGVDPSISQHVCLKETACSGYLVKLGGRVRNWKKRWFVLDFSKSYLCYFQDEAAFRDKTEPKGVINLQDIKDVYQTSKGDHLVKHIFLVQTPQRTYQIRAPTLPTLTVWMTLLLMPLSVSQQP